MCIMESLLGYKSRLDHGTVLVSISETDYDTKAVDQHIPYNGRRAESNHQFVKVQ